MPDRKLPREPDPGGAVAAVALVLVLAANALLVDPGAESSFDAPKRLATLLGVAVAAAAAFALRTRYGGGLGRMWRAATRTGRVAMLLLGVALAGSGAAALSSPRRGMALAALRSIGLLVLLLPLGASRVLERRGPLLLGVFLAGCAVNAAISIAELSGVYRPFELETVGGRGEAGALVGNVGYLTIALALGSVASLGILFFTRRSPVRAAAGVALALFVTAIVLNRNLTAPIAFAAGGMALAWSRFGRRGLAAAALLAGLLVAGAMAVPLTRARVREGARAAAAGDWDRLLTFRLGPWAAAAEMVRQRPLLGWGPGTYGAEFVPHRLQAELTYRARFVNPLGTSSYGEAHSDLLQPVAEGGLAGWAAAAAGLLLVVAAGRAARPSGTGAEPAILFAILLAGGAASLTWFPFQRTVTSVPLLLAAGRAWRVATQREAA